jgi:cysteine desulfurase
MGKAAELARVEMKVRMENLIKIRDYLIKELPLKVSHVIVTGHPQNRLPGHASFCVEFIEGESMLMLLNAKGVGVTSGSACTSRAHCRHRTCCWRWDYRMKLRRVRCSSGWGPIIRKRI